MEKRDLNESLRRVQSQKIKTRPEVLLSPRIPEPLHGVAPRNLLGPKWWNKTRQEAYRSTHYHCLACGVAKHRARYRQWLEAHELYEVDYRKGRMTYIETVPLCHLCHNFIHRGRTEALFSKGEMSATKYIAIVQHGEQTLMEAGLPLSAPFPGISFVRWEDWRLVLNGKEYSPKFKTYEQWKAAFS